MSKVLVTGATGFIAGHAILQLLEAGHYVRGTVRSSASGTKLLETLSRYAGKPISFELVEADLARDEGWDAAARDMDCVLHIASPFPAGIPKHPDELIIPARDGALRVLKAAKAASATRVVMTSSVAAVAYGWGENRPSPLTEAHWSNPDNLADNTAYTRSKTIAERAAWDYVAGDGVGLELTTINPAAVLGPVMSGDFSASLEILTQLMKGKVPSSPRVGFGIVDVRDVASAHILAMRSDRSIGKRFILADKFMWMSEVADVLRAEFPDYGKKLPKGTMPGWLLKLIAVTNPSVKQILPELGRERQLSNAQAKSVLGWSPRSAEEAILSGARSLIENKVV